MASQLAYSKENNLRDQEEAAIPFMSYHQKPHIISFVFYWLHRTSMIHGEK
jgi:hypothetical protein